MLAISHELRSPLTRARLNTELLPETPELQAQRQALLRDLGEMRDLVTDLLESERLGQGHAALHLEPTDLGALVREAAPAAAHAATMLRGSSTCACVNVFPVDSFRMPTRLTTADARPVAFAPASSRLRAALII